jgi:hypothetical protein
MHRRAVVLSLASLLLVTAEVRAGEAPAAAHGSAYACGPCYRNGYSVLAPPCDAHARSGYGLCVAPWARWTYNCDYQSYYVGGSARPKGWGWRVRPEPRYPWEGVWGTDYSPRLTAAELWWTHGGLYQDGPGQYEPDRKNLPFFLRFGK